MLKLLIAIEWLIYATQALILYTVTLSKQVSVLRALLEQLCLGLASRHCFNQQHTISIYFCITKPPAVVHEEITIFKFICNAP